MKIMFLRFFQSSISDIRAGIVINDWVFDISDVIGSNLQSILSNDKINNTYFLNELVDLCESRVSVINFSTLEKCNKDDEYYIVSPYSPPEIWGVGVTYSKTMQLHEEEFDEKSRSHGLYEYVYNSERPEIFFKGLGHHCVGPNDSFNIRNDSTGTILEAELACIYDCNGNIIAYTAANDITAWDIEKECPLFLSQAKIFKGCCSIGPCIVPAITVKDPLNLEVHCSLIRDENVIFSGKGSTSNMKRTLDELTKYLISNNVISDGALLCTGTAIGIPNDISLNDKDKVSITIEEIGTLNNTANQNI